MCECECVDVCGCACVLEFAHVSEDETKREKRVLSDVSPRLHFSPSSTSQPLSPVLFLFVRSNINYESSSIKTKASTLNINHVTSLARL